MQRPPRPPGGALLDRPALYFILSAGLLQGSVGLGLLAVLPQLGFGIEAIRTVVFLYESAAKVLSVYPARRTSGSPASNRALHAATLLGLVLSLLCVYLPGLRSALALSAPEPEGLAIVAGCVAVTWLLTESLAPLGRRWRRWNESCSRTRGTPALPTE